MNLEVWEKKISQITKPVFFCISSSYVTCRASQVVLVVKNPPANARDIRDMGSIPGLRRSPGGGHGNLLRYSCLENPVDRGAWWATVHEGPKSQTQLSRHTCTCVLGSGWGLVGKSSSYPLGHGHPRLIDAQPASYRT